MYLNINNLTIYYEKYGNANKTILILPGWGNTRETFHHIINYFKDTHTIYIIDYPGLGNSPIPDVSLTIYDYTELVIGFMKKLNIINPIIIAHSFGGRITTLLTGYYQIKIDKLILIDIAGIKPKRTIKVRLKNLLYKTLKKLIKCLPKRKQNKYFQKLFSHFASDDYKSIPPTMRATFKNIINEDLQNFLPNINSEALIIWGENDQDTPLKDAKKIQKLIKNSALIVLTNASHYSYLQYPFLTNKIIEEYIK